MPWTPPPDDYEFVDGPGGGTPLNAADLNRILAIARENLASLASYVDSSIAAALGGTTIPSNTGAPVISGSPIVGDVLSCSTGTWTGSPTGYAYQWNRSGTAISGATASTYTAASGDVGDTLRCVVTATNSAGTATATSAATAVVAAAVTAPVNSAVPTISGTTTQGDVLTATTGTWSGSPTYAYQWKRAGTAISGATASTYTLASADVGDAITVTVTATNSAGSASATSAASVTVTSAATLASIQGFTTSAWTESQNAVISSGVATVPIDSTYGSAVVTDTPEPLTNSSIYCKIATSYGNGSEETWLLLSPTSAMNSGQASNSIGFYINGGDITPYYKVSGTAHLGPATAAATVNEWFRIREAAGTTYWDLAPDNGGVPGTWTNIYSLADPIAVTSLYVVCCADYYGTESAANATFSLLNGVGSGSGGGGGGSATATYFAPTDPFNTAVSANPTIDPNSASIVDLLVSAATTSGQGAGVDAGTAFGYPIYQAASSDPVITNLHGTEYDTGPGFTFHLPAAAAPNTGSDGHLIIIEPGGDLCTEFWQATISGSGSGRTITANTIWQFNPSSVNGSCNNEIDGTYGGVDACGISLLAGCILPSEIAAGVIPHALRFAFHSTASTYRAPAYASDGNTSGGLPEGGRIWLPRSVSISNLNAPLQIVATAMQNYGAICVDTTGGGIEIFAESTLTVPNPPTGYSTNQNSMTNFPWSSCQVLATSVNP